MSEQRQKVYRECHQKLLKLREEVLNGISQAKTSVQQEVKGDEADMVATLLDQETNLIRNEKLFQHLKQIEDALARIERGTYGICEETEEPIEEARLLALPWTKLSLEGAEERERRQRVYARSS
ncbi:MAG: molecular chaperone DnaK [Bdellovibrionaceae bacterium]|nr:molecular chaperone DnaK [Pseudobdellovibrionaceae bacterium]|tara:strand:+ start:2033 stop:2404 length:372 start_codon:yes stop_codon:yes gene_type:complete